MIDLDYYISETDGITVIEFFCPPDFDGFLIAVSDVRARFPSKARLWDCTCGTLLSPDHLRSIGATAKRVDAAVKKVAIVVKNDGDFGLARMFSVHRTQPQTGVNIYRDKQEALVWLKKTDGD
jgi:hypothetical protein